MNAISGILKTICEGHFKVGEQIVGITVNRKTMLAIETEFGEASRIITPRSEYQVTAISGIEVVELAFQQDNALAYYDQVLFDLVIGRKFPDQEWFDRFNKKVL